MNVVPSTEYCGIQLEVFHCLLQACLPLLVLLLPLPRHTCPCSAITPSNGLAVSLTCTPIPYTPARGSQPFL
jgi:hypothetical protein